MENLLLLHGALGSSKSFDSFLPIISKSFNTYAFDCRGHGIYSTDTILTADILCNQLIEFVIINKLENTHVFGYSMGGYIAMLASIKRPALFGNIITLATKYEWNKSIALNETAQLKLLYDLPAEHPYLQQLILMHGINNYTNCITLTSKLMHELGDLQPLNASTFLLLKNKVLLLVGALDKMVSMEETNHVYQQLKDAKFIIMDQTKHPFDKVDLKQLSNLIEEFID